MSRKRKRLEGSERQKPLTSLLLAGEEARATFEVSEEKLAQVYATLTTQTMYEKILVEGIPPSDFIYNNYHSPQSL